MANRGFQSNSQSRRGAASGAQQRLLGQLSELVEAHASGSLRDPEMAYRNLMAAGLRHPVLFVNLAQLAMTANSLEEAEQWLEEALKVAPDFAHARVALGIVLRRRGNLQAAIENLEKAIQLEPKAFQPWLTLTVALHDAGLLERARLAAQTALDLNADDAAAHANASMVWLSLDDPLQAEMAARRSIALNPKLPEAHMNLGNALHRLEDWPEAIAAHERAVELRPGFFQAYSNLGNALRANDELEAAVDAFQASIQCCPVYYQAYSNLGITYRALGRFSDGIEACSKALELCPDSADILGNLGILYQEKGDLDQAESYFRRSLSLDSRNSESHYGLASVLLQRESFVEGWQEYEWRFAHNQRHPIVHEPRGFPRWLGPLQRKVEHLVLLHEQGLGDAFQFVRFAPLLRAYADRILFATPIQLRGLLSQADLFDDLLPIEFDADLQASSDLNPENTAWLPLLSAPLHLGIDASSAAVDGSPYLTIDQDRSRYWSSVLKSELGNGDILVGLNWQGNPEHEKTNSRGRSLPLELFSPLAEIEGVRFVSLQKGFGSEQLAGCSFRDRFVACQSEVDAAWDFEDATALMSCCELVISSDTSAAHLAGAIGAPVWILLKKVPEWRWGLSGCTSPWYPTARLFRQHKAGDWTDPVQDICAALQSEIMVAPS